MFIGHFAVGFAGKRWAPRTSLTTLIFAAIFLDVLWPIFLWLGIEHVRIVPGITAFTPLDFVSYPWSHSLVAAAAWSVLFGWIYRHRTGYMAGAVCTGLAVFSHWVLDFFTHRPDLPIAPGLPTKVGLGLWNAPIATVVIEGMMFVAGVAIYTRTTRARGVMGHVALWLFVALLVSAYIANWLGPPPPNENALMKVALLMSALMLWVVWIDRTHELRPAT